jgi:NAD(P)-dependent dehydrogenase (short-subunit alcohol dehydrogenase family)
MTGEYLNELFGLTGRTAVVIGGTGTLGSEIAKGLALAGATVVVAGRDADRVAPLVESLRQQGCTIASMPVDISHRPSLQNLLDAVVAAHGNVSMLVNCAGVNAATPYFDVSDDEWDRVFTINLKATHWACQVFGKHMADHGAGSIVNIGSVSAETPLSRVFAYSASKAGVVNLTRNLAREWAPRGVRVNVLCPGFFPAEQNRAILDAERCADIFRHTPMQRFGDPKELIGAVLLLLSPVAGSFITGATLYVDGGFTAMTI